MKRLTGIALGLAALTATPAFAVCQREAVSYYLPTQRLDQALQQVSHRSGCPVRIDPGNVADRRAPALRGYLTPEQAYARLVHNTGYTAYATPEGVAIDTHVLDVAMSEARGLRTLLDNAARGGKLVPARAARLRATLSAVEHDLPRQVNAQGMITPRQKADAVRRLESVRAAVGNHHDARYWKLFATSS